MASTSPPTPTPCEHCRVPTTQRCGQCRAFALCSRACQRATWKRHKPDCENVKHATAAAASAGYVPRVPDSVTFTTDPESLLALNAMAREVYDRHGIDEPPTRESTMPTKAKLAFFLDMLKTHDTSSEANERRSMGDKLLMNRRYNNTYRHCVEHLASDELQRLHRMMQRDQVGAAFKQPRP